ncbi:hypothetical protein Tco_1133500 [Tanacetum coccineum]
MVFSLEFRDFGKIMRLTIRGTRPPNRFPGIIMANLPNNNEFALAAEAAPDNMNGWVEEEDPEMEEEEEDPEEDPEMEEEEEEMDADEQ